jgi:hypothetical protein
MKKIVKYCLLLFFTATFINCYCQNEVFYYSGGKKHYLKTDPSSLMIQFKDYEECSITQEALPKNGSSSLMIQFKDYEEKCNGLLSKKRIEPV